MKRLLLLAGAVVGLGLLVSPWAGRALLWHWESNSILRGRLEAEEHGCMSCHRPFQQIEIPNPGSRWGVVPALQGGNALMYAKTPEDLEGFIRWGAPKSWTEKADVRERLDGQHIRMPAFESLLADDEVADLLAFVIAEGDFQLPGDEAAAAGRQLAREHGCVSCHGSEGSGGIPNPGSLGGFIPGFRARNFTDLVKDEAEFRAWVRFGTSDRLEKNPVVRWFWQRQKIQMPAFDGQLDEAQIGQLWAWVQAIRAAEAAAK